MVDSITRYNLAKFILDNQEITTDTFKITISQDTEEYTSSASHHPYAMSFSTETLEWELTDVDPIFRKAFSNQLKVQQENPHRLPSIVTYDYNEINGDLVEDDVFYEAYITEVEKENANHPFSVKGQALRRKQL